MLEKFSQWVVGYNSEKGRELPVFDREKMKQKRWWAIFKRFPERPHLVGAELGVAIGNMSIWLLQYKPSIHMTFVDVRRTPGWLDNVKSFSEDSYDFYEMPTYEASTMVPDNHFDFVFIDADHSYNAVKQDITDWLPKVKPGGWLCGHDYAKERIQGDRTPFPVKKAVQELLPDHELDVNDTWFYRKPTQ
jgi:hypothetical protein